MDRNFPYPKPTTPIEPCKIELHAQGTSWHCDTHNIRKDSDTYTEGDQFAISDMVNDIVVHVGEATTIGAVQAVILDLCDMVQGMDAEVSK